MGDLSFEAFTQRHGTKAARQKRVDGIPANRHLAGSQRTDYDIKLNRNCKVRGVAFREGETVKRLSLGEALTYIKGTFGCGRDARPLAELVGGELPKQRFAL